MLKLNEVKLAINFLSVLFDPENTYSYQQVLICLPGIGLATFKKLLSEADEYDVSSINTDEEQIRISSFLGSMQKLDLNDWDENSQINQIANIRRIPSLQSVIPESERLQQIDAKTILNKKQVKSVKLLFEVLKKYEDVDISQVQLIIEYLNKLNFFNICMQKANIHQNEKTIKENIIQVLDKLSKFQCFKDFSQLYKDQDEMLFKGNTHQDEEDKKVRFITIHQSKGLEFEHEIFLIIQRKMKIHQNLLKKREDLHLLH
ncbi:atp-dependent dna helicase [Stylonychia lemnae]|uniref:Atp-dependent dna helicase n=1 Tax=Stylonychia lemnae TaxID=5949 RepID=A0A078AUM9_STYLE|nr:atp-dependent dna helicase [Stylonychia lemnae]|eukprot:CDW84588.1 atp-dependent dna helicase [Stylonychia lemnae]